MLTKYRVYVMSLNKSGGESEETTQVNTYVEAENKFYDKCSSFAGNAQTAYVVIHLIDLSGRSIKHEEINRMPAPEPEPSEE